MRFTDCMAGGVLDLWRRMPGSVCSVFSRQEQAARLFGKAGFVGGSKERPRIDDEACASLGKSLCSRVVRLWGLFLSSGQNTAAIRIVCLASGFVALRCSSVWLRLLRLPCQGAARRTRSCGRSYWALLFPRHIGPGPDHAADERLGDVAAVLGLEIECAWRVFHGVVRVEDDVEPVPLAFEDDAFD